MRSTSFACSSGEGTGKRRTRDGLTKLLACVALILPLATGCASRFAGEWVQDGTVLPDGAVQTVAGGRRLALRFEPPATVRSGLIGDRIDVVEAETVSSDQYWTLQDRTVAQFGRYTARVEGDHLVANVGADLTVRLTRVRGPSVFPPLVKFPAVTHATEPARPPDVQTVARDSLAVAALP